MASAKQPKKKVTKKPAKKKVARKPKSKTPPKRLEMRDINTEMDGTDSVHMSVKVKCPRCGCHAHVYLGAHTPFEERG